MNRIFNLYNPEKRMIFAPRKPKRDAARKAEVRRTVARAAAFRARSWTLPVCGDPRAAVVLAAAPPPGGRPPSFVFGANRPPPAALGVRIYRPGGRRMWLAGLVGR